MEEVKQPHWLCPMLTKISQLIDTETVLDTKLVISSLHDKKADNLVIECVDR